MGPQRLASLIEGFGSPELAWQAPGCQLAQRCQWSERFLEDVEAYRRQWEPDPLSKALQLWKQGRGVLVPGDRRWPPAFNQVNPPSAVVHWSGRGSLWRHLSDRRAIAVVGTRRPSRHGLSVSRQIGAVLAKGGWPVVSGLAEGIDGAVHQACLDHQGVPIGVLGTPLERIYPRHHALLQASVGHHGLLVSELPPGAAVSKGSFARRNRLQVALASALILVECPLGSGALHSAELAWNEGLPLWVVPADTGRASAEGSNGLLARGATPLIRPEELLTALGQGPLRRLSPPERKGNMPGAENNITPQLLSAIGRGASLEEIGAALDRPPHKLLAHLLELEASGRLKVEPGLFWRPI